MIKSKSSSHVKTINVELAKNAAKSIDEIRNSKVFDKGKTGKEIILEWRDKRKYFGILKGEEKRAEEMINEVKKRRIQFETDFKNKVNKILAIFTSQ